MQVNIDKDVKIVKNTLWIVRRILRLYIYIYIVYIYSEQGTYKCIWYFFM